NECERDGEIKVIISLLSQVKSLGSIRLKASLTSRPELSIRLDFNMIKGKYQDLVLPEIPKLIIEHDIAAYLDFELASIRNEHNALFPNHSSGLARLPDCPRLGQDGFGFSFCSHCCRFLRDPAWAVG
ncbi:hypothetical protein QBC40DRAFT_319475, partial [Triangularia verruculosa]